MRRVLKSFATLALATASLHAVADTVLAPGATWEYTFTDPTAGAWTTTTGGWSMGAAPFGNTSGGDFGYATYWPASGSTADDLWIRRTVDFTGFDISTAHWDLGVDNGYKLYVNGTLLSAHNAEGFTSRWEYGGGFGATLHSGVNFVALALEDHGGATAFDMRITAAPVPEPETYAMMLAGLGVMGAVARRRKAS